MGQKVNPIGMRLAVNKNWRSRWFAGKKEFGALLDEDRKIRSLVRKRLQNAAISLVEIERYASRIRVTICTARPGIVVGRKGEDIERIREEIAKNTGKEVYIEIREIRNADANAQIIAENVSFQLLRRVSFRRAMKRAMKTAMDLGVEGIKIEACGRLGGSELARREWYKEGKVPLHTLRANIDYGFAEAATTAGKVGIKVWVCTKDEGQQNNAPSRRKD
ncbi:MAG: 30S ribosomal protein S3 [Lentisphaerales bacterium]|nr:MAG: 30S ribosomal protein S3 [Lentisphaerales bacterium]